VKRRLAAATHMLITRHRTLIGLLAAMLRVYDTCEGPEIDGIFRIGPLTSDGVNPVLITWSNIAGPKPFTRLYQC
jgi:hypothetical protein